MKYVIYEGGNNFVIIPETSGHNSFPTMRGEWSRSLKAISAGKIDIEINSDHRYKAYCHGDSVTLDLKAREEDSEIITRLMNI